MNSVQDFEKIKSAEEFFEFFDIEYDEDILKTKRYLILKLFSDLAANASMFDEEKRLEFYRFSLLKIYGDFVNGFIPTAAEVWGEAINHTCGGGGSCSSGGGHGEGNGSCSSGSCGDGQKSSCSSHGSGHGHSHEWA